MTTRFEGSLLVKKINSRNGAFCIGELVTDIGEFKVKDPLIDQFEEGKYQGSFWVSHIYPYSYSAFGRVVIEIRAKLADLQINTEDALPSEPDKPQEPDPADEEVLSQPAHPTTSQIATVAESETKANKPSRSATASTDANPVEQTDDLQLFGEELYELLKQGQPVKLDPTAARLQLRLQVKRLGILGYEFKPMIQTWIKPSH